MQILAVFQKKCSNFNNMAYGLQSISGEIYLLGLLNSSVLLFCERTQREEGLFYAP
jgi:hypothetical protein